MHNKKLVIPKFFKNLYFSLPIGLFLLVVVSVFCYGIFSIVFFSNSTPAKVQQIFENNYGTGTDFKIGQAEPAVENDFYLKIDKISVLAPVIINVDGNNKDSYNKALKNGVAHFKGTALPEDGNNIFIFGHSSNWSWSHGGFKEVFKRLPELSNGDQIRLYYEGNEYGYSVSETEIVEKTDVSWLKKTSGKVLTLMTCYPIGTNEKRFIVRAELMQ